MSDVWKGVALPWGKTIASYIEPKEDIYILKTSVLFIVLTRLGERPMLPDFGSALPESIFEMVDEQQATIIEDSVREAIRKWDDRIEVVDLTIRLEPDTHKIEITIRFKNKYDPLKVDEVEEVSFELSDTGIV